MASDGDVSLMGAPSGQNSLLPNGKKTKGRVKIKMEYIGNKLRRYTTFSKRKTGIMKKAFELSTLTGTQVMLLVASETGHVYAFATNKLKPMIASDAGRGLIQSCLNTPDDHVAEVAPCKTEFSFEPPAGCAGGTSRKRKIQDSETLCLPTMVPSASAHSTSPINVEEYCESDNDSDTNESPEPLGDPFDVKPSPVPSADPALLQKRIKDALRAASLQRQNVMQKKPKLSLHGHSNNHRDNSRPATGDSPVPNFDQLGALLPFMLQGLVNSSGGSEPEIKQEPEENQILYQMPQGVVYASAANDGKPSASSNGIFSPPGSSSAEADSAPSTTASPNPLASLLQFPINNMTLQQLITTAAISQLAEQNQLKG